MAFRSIAANGPTAAALGALLVCGCGAGGTDTSSFTADAPSAAAAQPGAPNWSPVAPMVAAGDGTSFVLTSSGVIFSWGNQVNGRLGDVDVFPPTIVGGLIEATRARPC